MRRLIVLALALGLLFALGACTAAEETASEPPMQGNTDPNGEPGKGPVPGEDDGTIDVGDPGIIGHGQGGDRGTGTPSDPEINPIGDPVPAPEIVCADTGLNDFDWPPPEPSTKVTIPRALLLAGLADADETLGTVSERLERALISAGYVEYGYQSVGCTGFALVTRLERIDEEGRPLEGEMRFAPPEAKPNWSLSEYISRLFYAPPGYYRQIVFAATDKPYDEDALAPPPTREQLDQMMADANVTILPEAMEARPFTRRHNLHALIYEFEKGPGDREVAQLKPSRLGGATHIRAAGIYDRLEGDDE